MWWSAGRGVWVRRTLGTVPEEACSPPEAPRLSWWEPWQDPGSSSIKRGRGWGGMAGSGWGLGVSHVCLGQLSSSGVPMLPQATAETVYDILSPAAPVSRSLQDKRSVRRLRRGQQPADLREGVAKAYDAVREGILDTAQTICDVASRGHEQKGLTGAVGGVIRQLPPTVVKPLILATEATSNLLGGMRNQILPDAHKDHTLKWRSDEAQD